jgi:hypothetical protein
MIKPTVGRIVWFHHNAGIVGFDDRDVPLAAIVTHVHSDTMVNLCVFGPNGDSYPKTSVRLEQEDGETHTGMYCRWMPYQKVQTEKTQQLAAMAAGGQ